MKSKKHITVEWEILKKIVEETDSLLSSINEQQYLSQNEKDQIFYSLINTSYERLKYMIKRSDAN